MKTWHLLIVSLIVLACAESTCLKSTEISEKESNPQLIIDSLLENKIPDDEIRSIRNYFKKFVEKRRFNGHIIIAKKGQIIFDTTSGYSNIKRRIKLEENSVLQLASITKPITATVILQLIEEGKLKIIDTITKYLPNLPKHYSHITVKDLLSHRSGLTQYYYYCDDMIDDKKHLIYNDTVLCVMDFHNPGNYFPPDRKHNYCNTNYLLLASIIETIEKQKYADVLNTRIIKKCGMENSFVFDLKDNLIPENLVLGHTKTNKLFNFDYLDGIVGDKGFFTNAKDLLKFDQMLTNGNLVNDSLMNEAFKPYNEIKKDKSYGLGWRLKFHKKLGKIVYHTGWWHGNRNIYIRVPKNEYTIIILSNALRGSIYNLEDILKEIEFPSINENIKRTNNIDLNNAI